MFFIMVSFKAEGFKVKKNKKLNSNKNSNSKKSNNNIEGTRPNAADYGGHPAPYGASPTQPYKCGQNVKIKTASIMLSNIVPPSIIVGDREGRPYGMVLAFA